jgi:hypothetical protein
LVLAPHGFTGHRHSVGTSKARGRPMREEEGGLR